MSTKDWIQFGLIELGIVLFFVGVIWIKIDDQHARHQRYQEFNQRYGITDKK